MKKEAPTHAGIYIHYGSDCFDLGKFDRIKNNLLFTKPEGGLWGSPIEAAYGWADWSMDIHGNVSSSSFRFMLRENANILQIRDLSDLDELPMLKADWLDTKFFSWALLDFEGLLTSGIDAILYEHSYKIKFVLGGWDCDSILVLNPHMIMPLD